MRDYAMSRMHLIARLVLTALGVQVLILFLDALGIASRFRLTGPDLGWLQGLCWAVVWLLLFGLAYWLFFRSEGTAIRMAGPVSEGDQHVDTIWIAAGFRAIFVLCGLLILVSRIETLVRVAAFFPTGPRVLVEMIVYKYVDERFDMPFIYWAEAFVNFCKGILGIYLILGAPQYVRWQVNKFCLPTLREAKVAGRLFGED